MDDKTLRALQRRDARRSNRYFQQLQASNRPFAMGSGWQWPGLAANPGFVSPAIGTYLRAVPGTLAVAWQPLKDLGAAGARLVQGALRWPWKKVAMGTAVAGVATVSLAATQVYVGFRDHPREFWIERLQQRLGSAIFSRDGQLQGTLFPGAKDAAGLDYANYGYIRPQGELPDFYRKAVMSLEQQTLYDNWRNVCGFDLLATGKRVLTGQGGGSGLAQQNAKNLLEPEEKRSTGLFSAPVDKLRELGAGCSLHLNLGGADGMMNLYGSYASVAQVMGTTRGAEAGAWVLFNTELEGLEKHQLGLLAALAQRPLSLVPVSAFDKGCPALKEALRNKQLKDDEAKAARQCFVIGRARTALLNLMPPGAERDEQLAKLDALEKTGIVPANPFSPLPTRKLVNLSARTRAAMSPAMLDRVAAEAEASQAPASTSLTLTLAQPEQQAFGASVRMALKQIDDSTAGRESLCVPLAYGSPRRQCPATPAEGARADVVLARMGVQDGGITRLFESSRLAFDANNAIGSVGKMIIALVAVQHGYTSDTPVCPRQARDGSKLLRRVTKPEYGYKTCSTQELISFTEAMARSDNLAAYEVARALPREALRRGIEAVGLTPDTDPKANLAYALAFGTQAGTPEELLVLGQALFGAAFGVPARSGGPRVLASNLQDAPAYTQVMGLLPQPAQRLQLRALLQAPVEHPKGTLHYMQGALGAGKTGTTSAPYGPQPGFRRYVQAKYTLGYVPADRTVVLSIINAPAGHALGLHSLGGQTLQPALQALLQ